MNYSMIQLIVIKELIFLIKIEDEVALYSKPYFSVIKTNPYDKNEFRSFIKFFI